MRGYTILFILPILISLIAGIPYIVKGSVFLTVNLIILASLLSAFALMMLDNPDRWRNDK